MESESEIDEGVAANSPSRVRAIPHGALRVEHVHLVAHSNDRLESSKDDNLVIARNYGRSVSK